MKINHDTFANDQVYKRAPIPNTDALKSSIIQNAKGLPQQAPSFGSRSSKFLAKYRLAFGSAVAFCVLFLAVINLSEFYVGDQIEPLITLSEADLDWQELMLVDDELLFASL